eukprot:GHVU01173477.1.p1 GENE.GHVU01173477.1~~GHVU01173477.1.p1  ORF type:complete len:377 (-),score=35.40 GHVU01173477.1:504-1634(-)
MAAHEPVSAVWHTESVTRTAGHFQQLDPEGAESHERRSLNNKKIKQERPGNRQRVFHTWIIVPHNFVSVKKQICTDLVFASHFACRCNMMPARTFISCSYSAASALHLNRRTHVGLQANLPVHRLAQRQTCAAPLRSSINPPPDRLRQTTLTFTPPLQCCHLPVISNTGTPFFRLVFRGTLGAPRMGCGVRVRVNIPLTAESRLLLLLLLFPCTEPSSRHRQMAEAEHVNEAASASKLDFESNGGSDVSGADWEEAEAHDLQLDKEMADAAAENDEEDATVAELEEEAGLSIEELKRRWVARDGRWMDDRVVVGGSGRWVDDLLGLWWWVARVKQQQQQYLLRQGARAGAAPLLSLVPRSLARQRGTGLSLLPSMR